MEALKEALVLKSTGKNYQILNEDGQQIEAVLRGNWRTKGLRTTNPIAVGDQVFYEEDKDGSFVIKEMRERKNHIIRRSINLSKESHIVAANIDLALLIVTADKPPTSFGFIDRFLVAAESYHIPSIIVINKIDMKESEERIAELMMVYEQVGYPLLLVSALKEKGLEDLRDLLHGRVTALATAGSALSRKKS